MPFTFAHPAAVIPLKRRWKDKFCLTGLAFGSMAPDFEYFIQLKPVSLYGHNIIGFFILNLPLCFLLAFVFHFIIKKPLILHMPNPIDKWFSIIAHRVWTLDSIKKVFRFCYSALLGMFTHVVWDSFTHDTGTMVILIPLLASKLYVLGYLVPIYKVLQHGSSLFGFFVIVAYFYGYKNINDNKQAISTKRKIRYIISTFLISFILLFGIMLMMATYRTTFNIGVFIVTSIDCIILGLLLASLLSRQWLSK